jgi:hypothetical protein
MHQDLKFWELGFPNRATVDEMLISLAGRYGLDCVIFFITSVFSADVTLMIRPLGCERTGILSRTV